MAYRRIGLAGGQLVERGPGPGRQGYGGPQDWGQEAAAKQQGAANVPDSNPYSNVAQQNMRDFNERVDRRSRSNISRQNYQQGVKDFYNQHQGGLGGGIRNAFGGIRNFFGGLGSKIGDWAGKMRGGINPATGEYYTQDEYEDNLRNRRDKASIDRIRKTKGLYDTGVIKRDWDQSPLKDRLASLEKGQWDRMSAMGMPTDTGYPGEGQGIEETAVYDDYNFPGQSGVISEAEYNAYPEFNFNTGPEVLPTGTQFTGNLEDYQRGLVQEAGALKIDPKLEGMGWLDKAIDWETAGALGTGNAAKAKMMKANPDMTWAEAANMARKNELPFGYTFALNPALKELDYGGKEGLFKGSFGEVEPQFENIIGGQGRGFLNIADPDLKKDYQENLQTGGYYDEPYHQYLEKNYPKTIPSLQKEGQWLSQGGRVGYNTGGRVGILAAF